MFEGFADWLNRPYREGMSALDWVLFVFLILFALGLWGWIMSRVQ